MLQGYEDLHVTQMEVEEVNPSPKSITTRPSNTKELSTKKQTFAKLPAKEELAECDHQFLFNGADTLRCKNCGIIVDADPPF